jgi:3,4-dihydroxy 2-butanone 4-phosphate synthase/GTP cyclohydrolase II
MTLLTSSKAKLAALEGFGLTVVDRIPLRDANVAPVPMLAD